MDINKSIFISHSKHDEAEVKYVIAWLEELGFKTWASFEDIHDRNFLEMISTTITRQDYFLLVLSNESISSGNVQDEIFKAYHYKKKIFIYALEDVSYPEGIDLILLRIQRIDKFKFPKDHLSRLAKIILNESSARPGEVERHVSNCLADFNTKTEQARLKYLANIRAWTDEYLNSRWENGKFKREPSKICSEQLKDLADSLGLKNEDTLKVQKAKRDKRKFLTFLNSAFQQKTITIRSLKTLEKRRYQLGVSKKEVKESIFKRKIVPLIIANDQPSTLSADRLDITWIIECLQHQRASIQEYDNKGEISQSDSTPFETQVKNSDINRIDDKKSSFKEQSSESIKTAYSPEISKINTAYNISLVEPRCNTKPIRTNTKNQVINNSTEASNPEKITITDTQLAAKTDKNDHSINEYVNPKEGQSRPPDHQSYNTTAKVIDRQGFSILCLSGLMTVENKSTNETILVQCVRKTEDGFVLTGMYLREKPSNTSNENKTSYCFKFKRIETATYRLKFIQSPFGETLTGKIDPLKEEGRQLLEFITTFKSEINATPYWQWINPKHTTSGKAISLLLKHQDYQVDLISKIKSYDVYSHIDSLFRDLKKKLAISYGDNLLDDVMTKKLLRNHGISRTIGYNPLLAYKESHWPFRRSMIVFDRGVSLLSSSCSPELFQLGVPGQRVENRIKFTYKKNKLSVKVLSRDLQSKQFNDTLFNFWPIQSCIREFSTSLREVLIKIDIHQLNQIKLRESLLNELWEGLSLQTFSAPINLRFYVSSTSRSSAQPILDPVVSKLLTEAKVLIPDQESCLFSLSASHPKTDENFLAAFLVSVDGVAIASKTSSSLWGRFIDWESLSSLIYVHGPSSVMPKSSSFQFKSSDLPDAVVLWPTLPGKEQVFSEIAAFVMSLKERLSTLPAR